MDFYHITVISQFIKSPEIFKKFIQINHKYLDLINFYNNSKLIIYSPFKDYELFPLNPGPINVNWSCLFLINMTKKINTSMLLNKLEEHSIKEQYRIYKEEEFIDFLINEYFMNKPTKKEKKLYTYAEIDYLNYILNEFIIVTLNNSLSYNNLDKNLRATLEFSKINSTLITIPVFLKIYPKVTLEVYYSLKYSQIEYFVKIVLKDKYTGGLGDTLRNVELIFK